MTKLALLDSNKLQVI